MEHNNLRLKTILEKQEKLLDSILLIQGKMHSDVKERHWVELSSELSGIKELSDAFVCLDEQREALIREDGDLYLDAEVRDVLFRVRSKLTKSKIENQALSSYVQMMRKFIGGVIDSVVPQKKNVLYNRNGIIKKSASSSLVVNTVF